MAQDGEPSLPPPLPRSFHEELRKKRTASQTPSHAELGVQAADTARHRSEAEPVFQPCHIFFYGSLMGPDVLQTVLDLPQLPVLQTGWIQGFTMRMWGIYPALVPADDAPKVSGAVWRINEESHMKRLMDYETSAYVPCHCTIYLENGHVLLDCRVFVWAGDSGSTELEEGSFDLGRYGTRSTSSRRWLDFAAPDLERERLSQRLSQKHSDKEIELLKILIIN
jgi:gamma-glutamylcyclotransferase (GGCT)/AIG2-like uncharacterized protein YtfP